MSPGIIEKRGWVSKVVMPGQRRAEATPGHDEKIALGQAPYLISTSPTWLVKLSAITGLPSGVTSILRTMSPPPGIAQLWNWLLRGSKRTIVFGLAADSLYQTPP